MNNTDTVDEGLSLASRSNGGLLRVWMAVVSFVVVGVGASLYWRQETGGAMSALYLAIIAFTWVNLMITLWEITLHLRIDLIEKQSEAFVREYRGRELDRVIDFFNSPMKLMDVFRLSTWAEVWSSYSVFDDAYANRKSFGFWADTGNGFITPIPSLILIYGLTTESMPAQIIGMLGLVAFWQMFYGTVIYFWAYIASGQYKGHKLSNLLLFIVGTNGLWMVFPLLGMWVSAELILSNSYSILQ